ncbi:MAG: hypothetical protein QOI20_3293 [Acidimicrobiaceae bacterium]|nr:hypothetical protein [Acidimicrobiaceae bacterium]
MKHRNPTTLLVVLVAFAVLATACGPSARVKTLRAGLVTLNAARDGIDAYDADRDAAFTERAGKAATKDDLDKLTAEIATHRKARAAAQAALLAAYAALSLAATLDDDPSLRAALAAVGELGKAYDALRGATAPTTSRKVTP